MKGTAVVSLVGKLYGSSALGGRHQREAPNKEHTSNAAHTCSKGRRLLGFHLSGLQPRREFSAPASSEGHDVCLFIFDLKKKRRKEGRGRGGKERRKPPRHN